MCHHPTAWALSAAVWVTDNRTGTWARPLVSSLRPMPSSPQSWLEPGAKVGARLYPSPSQRSQLLRDGKGTGWGVPGRRWGRAGGRQAEGAHSLG